MFVFSTSNGVQSLVNNSTNLKLFTFKILSICENILFLQHLLAQISYLYYAKFPPLQKFLPSSPSNRVKGESVIKHKPLDIQSFEERK